MKHPVTPTLAICLAAGLAAGIALARPGGPSASDVPPDAPPAAAVDVPAPARGSATSEPIEIRDFGFNRVTVPRGSVVEVRNIDGVEHSVSADDGSFDTGVIAGPGAATFVAPNLPGTSRFFCSVHPSMTGELVVK